MDFVSDLLLKWSCGFSSFILLIWSITLIDMLSQICIPGINPFWSGCLAFCVWLNVFSYYSEHTYVHTHELVISNLFSFGIRLILASRNEFENIFSYLLKEFVKDWYRIYELLVELNRKTLWAQSVVKKKKWLLLIGLFKFSFFSQFYTLHYFFTCIPFI